MKGQFIFRSILLLVFIWAGLVQVSRAQDSLPQFSVIDKGNGNVVVSWINPYPNLIQVAVQRSYDSLRRFSTIYSAESPELPRNGFTDKISPAVKVYYRIFYAQAGGDYFFTKSKRSARDTGVLTTETDLRRDKVTETIREVVKTQPDRRFFVKVADTLITSLMEKEYVRFKDSIIARTKDTLTLLQGDTILLKRYQPPIVYHTSIYVYPNRDGYIVLDLPDALTKRYDLIVTEEDDTPVLEIKKVKASYLILDKADFYHSGWYRFELREDGRLKEKNKFFLARDF